MVMTSSRHFAGIFIDESRHIKAKGLAPITSGQGFPLAMTMKDFRGAKRHLRELVSRVSFSFLSSYSAVEISPAA